MRIFRANCLAALLVLLFSLPVFAGDISSPGVYTSNDPTTTEPAPETEDPGLIATISGDISSPGMFEVLLAAFSIF